MGCGIHCLDAHHGHGLDDKEAERIGSPPNGRELGRACWRTFYTAAANVTDEKKFQSWFEAALMSYPCEKCRPGILRAMSELKMGDAWVPSLGSRWKTRSMYWVSVVRALETSVNKDIGGKKQEEQKVDTIEELYGKYKRAEDLFIEWVAG